jgi:hypothetical protein
MGASSTSKYDGSMAAHQLVGFHLDVKPELLMHP